MDKSSVVAQPIGHPTQYVAPCSEIRPFGHGSHDKCFPGNLTSPWSALYLPTPHLDLKDMMKGRREWSMVNRNHSTWGKQNENENGKEEKKGKKFENQESISLRSWHIPSYSTAETCRLDTFHILKGFGTPFRLGTLRKFCCSADRRTCRRGRPRNPPPKFVQLGRHICQPDNQHKRRKPRPCTAQRRRSRHHCRKRCRTRNQRSRRTPRHRTDRCHRWPAIRRRAHKLELENHRTRWRPVVRTSPRRIARSSHGGP